MEVRKVGSSLLVHFLKVVVLEEEIRRVHDVRLWGMNCLVCLGCADELWRYRCVFVSSM